MHENHQKISIIPLRCNSCGHELSGAEDDVFFLCPLCGVGWEVEGNGLVSRKAFYVHSPATLNNQAPLVYLPFWVFEIHDLTLSSKRARTTSRLMDEVQKMKRIYVEAYDSFMGDVYGNLALRYLKDLSSYEFVPPGRIVGCTRLSGRILPYIRHYILRHLDKTQDVTDMEISFNVSDIFIAGFPYSVKDEHTLIDLMTGLSILTMGIMNFHVFRREFRIGTGDASREK